jgi:hypothetical protein
MIWRYGKLDVYKIRIKDHLEDYWKHLFDEMTLVNLENGEVELFGPIENQDKLFDLITKIRDLNMTLISIDHLENVSDLEKGSNDLG